MAITLMFGTLLGALIGAISQSTGTPICRYLQAHPALFKLVGLVLATVAIVIPAAALTGVLALDSTPFFWGGCLVCSLVFGFFCQCFVSSRMQEVS